MRKHLPFSILFAIVFVLQLFIEEKQWFDTRFIVKPLIVISLLAYLFQQTKLHGRFLKRVFIALVFSLIGDVLLLFVGNGQIYFIGGLLAFLVAHLFYIGAFNLDFRSKPEAPKLTGHIALGIFGVAAMAYYLFIRTSLGTMRLPVLIYTFVITIMAVYAAYRRYRVNNFSFILMMAGAAIFVVSDASLAYAKFVAAYAHSGTLIMGTYMLAQYLLAIGAIERKLV